MKKNWIWILIVIVVVVLIGGYLGRHKIKALLGGSSTQVPVSSTSSAPASSNPNIPSNNIYMSKTDTAKGNYITDFQGMTLYVFDKDTQGVSNCNGTCATLWPAYTSGATAQSQFPEHITVITRSDGSKQFAWDGRPLYYYSLDKKAGDINGDGVNGVWHLVK